MKGIHFVEAQAESVIPLLSLSWRFLPVAVGISLIHPVLSILKWGWSQEYDCGCAFGDDDDMFSLEHFAEEEGESLSNIFSMTDAETVLRYCLIVAVLVFLYASFSLQQTILQIGMVRCKRKILRWNELVHKSARRVTITP